MKINERIIKAAIEFAKLSIHLSSKDESRLVIEMAEKYLRDEASKEEVKVVAHAAYAADATAANAGYTPAYAAAAAAAHAAYATYTAVYVAEVAAYTAVHVATCAAKAIAHASGFEWGTKEWHLKRLGVLKQCLVIARRTFGLIK